MPRRTRIVATLGPATDRPGVLERLLETGLNVARINFSHGSAPEHRDRIARFRAMAQQMGKTAAVLADLPGPKLRVLMDGPRELAVGQTLEIALPKGKADVAVTEPEALLQVKAGDRVLLDDGRLQGKVLRKEADRVVIHFEDGGTLLPNKGINLPDSELAIPAVTERDRAALQVALDAGVDWVALSFVRRAGAADELRAVMRSLGRAAPILAKMERPEAVAHAAEIVEAFDGIMVARGDLGVEIALEQVPHVQKRLIHQARLAGKPVITATDMLDSMRHNPRPTRAEASDVANAVYDGTDAVMLSGETAVGDFPTHAIACMDRILAEAEAHQSDDAPRGVEVPKGDLNDHVTHLTCDLARDTGAQAIVVAMVSGRTVRLIARHRPGQRIVAVSSDAAVLRQSCLVWGVTPVLEARPSAPGADRLHEAVLAATAAGALQQGELAIVVAGHPVVGRDRWPTVRVVRIGPGGMPVEP